MRNKVLTIIVFILFGSLVTLVSCSNSSRAERFTTVYRFNPYAGLSLRVVTDTLTDTDYVIRYKDDIIDIEVLPRVNPVKHKSSQFQYYSTPEEIEKFLSKDDPNKEYCHHIKDMLSEFYWQIEHARGHIVDEFIDEE